MFEDGPASAGSAPPADKRAPGEVWFPIGANPVPSSGRQGEQPSLRPLIATRLSGTGFHKDQRRFSVARLAVNSLMRTRQGQGAELQQ